MNLVEAGVLLYYVIDRLIEPNFSVVWLWEIIRKIGRRTQISML